MWEEFKLNYLWFQLESHPTIKSFGLLPSMLSYSKEIWIVNKNFSDTRMGNQNFHFPSLFKRWVSIPNREHIREWLQLSGRELPLQAAHPTFNLWHLQFYRISGYKFWGKPLSAWHPEKSLPVRAQSPKLDPKNLTWWGRQLHKSLDLGRCQRASSSAKNSSSSRVFCLLVAGLKSLLKAWALELACEKESWQEIIIDPGLILKTATWKTSSHGMPPPSGWGWLTVWLNFSFLNICILKSYSVREKASLTPF